MKSVLGRRQFLKGAAQAALAAQVFPCFEKLAQAQAKPAHAHGAQAAAGPKVALSVRELGAAGDGKTNDTTALQQAIDRCSVLGGGDVVVPAGDYSTGALVMRSNVTLRLEQGARILAWPILRLIRWPRCGGKDVGSRDIAR